MVEGKDIAWKHYEEKGVFYPYQIKLDCGQLIYAPDDTNNCIQTFGRNKKDAVVAACQPSGREARRVKADFVRFGEHIYRGKVSLEVQP